MLIMGKRFTKVKGARQVSTDCANCNNSVMCDLYYSKVGPGLSVPITPFFTDKFMLAYKVFLLICPICSAMEKVSRDQARQLGA